MWWYDRYKYYFDNIKGAMDKLSRLCDLEDNLLIIKEYVENFKENKNIEILEIWCGLWYTTYALNESWYSCKWIDIWKESIKKAKENFGNYYLQWDANKLSNQEQHKWKYDIVFSTQVIEHIHDVYKFINNIRLFLKKNWVIILTTPNKDFLKNNYIWFWDKPTVHTNLISKKFFENYSKKNWMDLINFDYIKHIKSKNTLLYILAEKIVLLFSHNKYYNNPQINFNNKLEKKNTKIKNIIICCLNNYFFRKISFYILNYIYNTEYLVLWVILKNK